jgi:hypothetical protein
MEARRSPAYEAGLKFRFYEGKSLLACSLLYSGAESLASAVAAKVHMPLLYGFEKGLAAWRNSPWWTVPQFVSSPKQVGSPAQHLLWKRQDGLYGVLLPLGGNGAKASLGAQGGDFGLDLGSGAPGFSAQETPLFVAGASLNPYQLSGEAAQLASACMGQSFLPRTSKPFPELFEGIGWCSWNTYYYDVDESKLLASARSMAEAKFPVHYILIDDGWSSMVEGTGPAISADKPWPGTGRMLWDFEADKKKFPKGIKSTLEAVKKLCGVKSLGVWHAFLGYWSYVHPESPLAKRLGSALMPSANAGLVPDPREKRASVFYDLWYDYLKSEGVSFLKVDDQSSVQFAFKGILPVQEAARGLEEALQRSANAHFLKGALINCMAMSWENVGAFNQSNIARSSNDFLPTVPDNGPQHLACNIYNSLWLSQIVTPDFDMFESHHPEGVAHALLRAISGGPVYFTDKPGQEDWALLRKLITADGRLLRADQPALPSRDMLFEDPLEKSVALKSFTRAGNGAALACFNVFRGLEAVTAKIQASDVEGFVAGEHMVYEHFSGEARLLGAGQSWTAEIEKGGQRLYVLAPVEDGFAALGLLDKFLSPRAVEGVERKGSELRVKVREAGRFGFYSRQGVETVAWDGAAAKFDKKADGWYEVAFEGEAQGPCELLIRLKK